MDIDNGTVALSSELESFAFRVYGGAPTLNLMEAAKLHGEQHVKDAILATEKAGKKSWAYTNGILKRWAREGYPSPDAIQGHKTDAELTAELHKKNPLTQGNAYYVDGKLRPC